MHGSREAPCFSPLAVCKVCIYKFLHANKGKGAACPTCDVALEPAPFEKVRCGAPGPCDLWTALRYQEAAPTRRRPKCASACDHVPLRGRRIVARQTVTRAASVYNLSAVLRWWPPSCTDCPAYCAALTASFKRSWIRYAAFPRHTARLTHAQASAAHQCRLDPRSSVALPPANPVSTRRVLCPPQLLYPQRLAAAFGSALSHLWKSCRMGYAILCGLVPCRMGYITFSRDRSSLRSCAPKSSPNTPSGKSSASTRRCVHCVHPRALSRGALHVA